MATIALDQTIRAMGFEETGVTSQFAKKLHGGQVLVTFLEGGQRVRINARNNDGVFLLSQSFARRDRWGVIYDALNKAAVMLIP